MHQTSSTGPKRVFISGVSRGLGKALALELANRGVQVFGCARDAGQLSELSRRLGPDHRLAALSVTDRASLNEFATEILDTGPVDMVIANAGVIHDRRPFWELSDDAWRAAVEVNILGVVNVARAFLDSMIGREQGVFVAMSSGWGRSPSWGLGPYCASKFAVEGLVGVLEKDLPPDGVRAVALDPGGGIDTDMLVRCLPDEHAQHPSAEVWAGRAATFLCDEIWPGSLRGSLTVPAAHSSEEGSS